MQSPITANCVIYLFELKLVKTYENKTMNTCENYLEVLEVFKRTTDN